VKCRPEKEKSDDDGQKWLNVGLFQWPFSLPKLGQVCDAIADVRIAQFWHVLTRFLRDCVQSRKISVEQ